MSTEKATLDDFVTTLEAIEQTESDQLETAGIPDWREVVGESSTNSQCQRCGSHVPAAFRRTHGDNSGQVFGCMSCYSKTAITRGAAVEGCDGEEVGFTR